MTDDGASDPTESDDSWWSIEGETTGERVRNGAPQLAIVIVLAWFGTSVAYNALSAAFDPITARASIVLGALYVGLRLRRWLLVDGGAESADDAGPEDADSDDADSDDADSDDADAAHDEAVDDGDGSDPDCLDTGADGSDTGPNGDAAAK